MNGSTGKWTLLALISATILFADQVTKYLAVEHLTYAFQVSRAHTLPEKVKAFLTQKNLLERGLTDGRQIQVVRNFWQFQYTQNRGAAWGFLSRSGEKFRVPFFHLISIAAVIFIFSYYHRLAQSQRYLQVALALVLGGALGNALCRVLRGYVIDFIDWHWFDPFWQKPHLHWPTFNIADSAITVGLVMLVLEMLLTRKAASDRAGKPSP